VPKFQIRLHKYDDDKAANRVKLVQSNNSENPKESCIIMKRLSLVLLGVGCMLFQSAQATPLFSEGFNYSPGNLVGNGSWTGGATTGLQIAGGNLSYAGLQDLGGNELEIINGSSQTAIATFANQTSGQIYYSFLFNATAVNSANNYFTAMNPGTSTPNGGSDAIDAYFYSSGKIEVRGNAQSATAGTGTALSLNTTYLIVEMIDLDAKTASLWIDPDSSTFGGTAPTATATLSGIAATAVDNVGFKAQAAAGGPFYIDNLLIGTTWADVTPTPEPTTCALAGLGLLGLVIARRMRK